ncbi:MAG TPA: nucleoside-diphosphate kinase [Candidatus Saccharimonadales bacterium]|nr:nucleoside-diphosphate kinase [Candidatus Saccharimonadales bacterium]
MIERTLVVFKPDAVQRGVVGEILTRFERVGLKIVGTKMIAPDKDHYFTHYEGIGKMISRRGQEAFDLTLEFMTQGPVIAFVLEGVEAVEEVRKMVGGTAPKDALPGTIRGDYAHISFGYADDTRKGIPNLLHASGDAQEAKAEIDHWFKSEELFDYQSMHEKYTR